LIEIGERAWNLKRTINHRLGLTAEDDRLPAHLLEPFEDAQDPDFRIPFEDMLRAYHEARGWDPVTGQPTPETMRSLGLDSLIEGIW
jgi:aldehyde:ferredoxin oxidoreductase